MPQGKHETHPTYGMIGASRVGATAQEAIEALDAQG